MNVIAIIQARMGSTRLPGKVLKDLAGSTVLARVVNRTRSSPLISKAVVATSVVYSDDPIVHECDRLAVACFRGNEEDVLDRYYRAAQQFCADVVVRITSDCPLIDPELIDVVLRAFLERKADYATNALVITYPRGLDVEVFTYAALDQARRAAYEPYQRVHVTPYFYENPDKFKIVSLAADGDYSNHRWTLDTTEDLEVIQQIYRHFRESPNVGWREVLSFVERCPEVSAINSNVKQKAVTEG